ncbi:hypothetical protein [Alistipes communis]|uniref:hypothetical protein n=1 Tax=Alistipes communis TaxID=2585118 RepID=UPI003FD83BE0
MAIRDAIIAVDFDGTVVTHAYPHIGNDIGAVPVLRELIGNGCRVILYTMRSGRLLDDAVAWFARNDIPLYAVNENPAQREWTDSPKVFADLYIDDSALGCPIKFEDGIKRPFVNWVKVRQRLVEEGFLDCAGRHAGNPQGTRLICSAGVRHERPRSIS